MSKSLPYRPAAAVMLINAENKVFVAQRIDSSFDAWQMPQGGLDEGESARDVHDLVRGLWPWPHAYAFLGGTRFILHRTRLSPMPASALAGTILAASAGAGLHVACGDGTIEIIDLQLEGKRVLAARDAMASGLLTAGARFSTP